MLNAESFKLKMIQMETEKPKDQYAAVASKSFVAGDGSIFDTK